MATQMQLEVFWRGIALPPELQKRRNANKVQSFQSDVIYLYFMSTLTWITDKKIKNKEDEFRWK